MNRGQYFIGKWAMMLLMVAVLFACKSANVSTVGPDAKWSTGQIIRAHNQAQGEFTTLTARAQLTLDNDNKKQKVSLTLRMQHKDTIWIKASVFGVTLAKGLLTPDRVQLYESLSKTYFDGSFDAVRQWLGLSLNFDQLERLLLGQSIVPLAKSMGHTVHQDTYRVGPTVLRENWTFSTEIRPQDFKIAQVDLVQKEPLQTLRIAYPSYTSGDLVSPEEIVMTSKGAQANTTIEVVLKNIEYGGKLRFPYAVPQGFKKINLAP